MEVKLHFVMQTPHTLKETGLGFYASQENHVDWVKDYSIAHTKDNMGCNLETKKDHIRLEHLHWQ